MKSKITIIKLGHIDHFVNIQKIKKWKSNLFEVINIQCVEHLPDSEIIDGFLDQKFTKEKLSEIISCPKGSDFAIAIMPYRFIDNFYMHRIRNNCVVISLCGISDILEKDNISTENFIIKQIYEICAIKNLVNDIASDDVYQFVHLDTRGCIFDMNGQRSDILYNTEKPIICESCKNTFKKKQINAEIVSILEKELKRIKKPLILRIERYIRKYPLVSVILSILLGISLNLISNLIFYFCTK